MEKAVVEVDTETVSNCAPSYDQRRSNPYIPRDRGRGTAAAVVEVDTKAVLYYVMSYD